MSAVIRKLKNYFTKKIIFPETVLEAVYDNAGNRLDNLLNDIDATKLGGELPSAFVKNNDIELNVNIPLASGWAATEYCRYHRFGKLVVIDFGGVARNAVGSGVPFIASGIPIMRTRPVAPLFDARANAQVGNVYGVINSTTINASIFIANTGGYGQIAYLTD